MAAKDTLANLFGSLMILIDQPFHVGDWITFPGGDGVVEEIGLRSTRVRTFAKTVVSIPNHALANATVENHSLMPKRRIKFTLGVTYDSSVEQIRQLVADIENYLRSNGDIEQEFMLVKFTTFNECSLDLFVYCFTVTTDWTQHLAVRQEHADGRGFGYEHRLPDADHSSGSGGRSGNAVMMARYPAKRPANQLGGPFRVCHGRVIRAPEPAS